MTCYVGTTAYFRYVYIWQLDSVIVGFRSAFAIVMIWYSVSCSAVVCFFVWLTLIDLHTWILYLRFKPSRILSRFLRALCRYLFSSRGLQDSVCMRGDFCAALMSIYSHNSCCCTSKLIFIGISFSLLLSWGQIERQLLVLRFLIAYSAHASLYITAINSLALLGHSHYGVDILADWEATLGLGVF